MDEISLEAGVVTVVHARMSSRRLPGKPLLPLGDATVLEQVVRRARAAHFGNHLLVATSTDPSDAPIRELCAARHLPCFAGSLEDLLDRTICAARSRQASLVVRCSASHPLLDPQMLDACARYALDSGMDYVCVRGLPAGAETEAFPLYTLLRLASLAMEAREREQITPFLRATVNLFDKAFLPSPPRLNRPDVRLTLETEQDYDWLAYLYSVVAPREDGLIHTEDVLTYLDASAQRLAA